MQTPPQYWNTAPQAPRGPSTAKIVLIVLGVFGLILLLCCGGGAFALWRAGAGNVLSCSDLMGKGRYNEAIPACRGVVAKIPHSAAAHNNLAWCLILDGQVQEGLAEAQTAVRISPARERYDTLALALALAGRGKEALQVETDHVMVHGDVANDSERVTLGMTYYATGDKQAAHKQWEIARAGASGEARKLAARFESQYP